MGSVATFKKIITKLENKIYLCHDPIHLSLRSHFSQKKISPRRSLICACWVCAHLRFSTSVGPSSIASIALNVSHLLNATLHFEAATLTQHAWNFGEGCKGKALERNPVGPTQGQKRMRTFAHKNTHQVTPQHHKFTWAIYILVKFLCFTNLQSYKIIGLRYCIYKISWRFLKIYEDISTSSNIDWSIDTYWQIL